MRKRYSSNSRYIYSQGAHVPWCLEYESEIEQYGTRYYCTIYYDELEPNRRKFFDLVAFGSQDATNQILECLARLGIPYDDSDYNYLEFCLR